MKTIKQKVKFKANPHVIYELLMDSKKHSAFTDDKALISRKVNEKVSAYSWWVEGENIKLKENAEIVQKWRGADWPKGVYSTATFKLKITKINQ